MTVVGITGTSGSGKSTVAGIIQQNYNAQIIDADQIAKELTQQDTEYLRKITKTFGEEILENGKLNRKKLADIIFSDKKQKEKIDKLTQKYVVDEIKKQVKESKNKLVLLDVPLLFETKVNEICDITIGVIADKKQKIERICKRDNIEEKQALARLSNQKDDKFFSNNCDYIVKNCKEEELKEEIRKILPKLQ